MFNRASSFQYRVSDDIAVVGYEDIELARYFQPLLTTIWQPSAAAGRALVEALLSLAEQKST